jgi:hypothetical protein
MDAIVEAALRKWPHVPHCYGWLALDARGHWYMRDERIQAAGPFPQIKGSRIEHDKLLGFIHRNYALDARGAAYFQNGPQRVYVELEAAPWVWRLQAACGPDAPAAGHGADKARPVTPDVSTHSGLKAHVQGAWLDEQGRLFLACDIGFGIVHSLDMDLAAQAVESGAWLPQEMAFAQMPAHFGYVLQPRPQPASLP